jgi:hypothetical protein
MRRPLAILVAVLVGTITLFATDIKGWSDSCCETTTFHVADFPGLARGEGPVCYCE